MVGFKQIIGLSLFFVTAAGCANTERTATAPTTQMDVVPAQQEMGAPSIDALPPQELAEGSCGVFLWAQDTRRALVFFAESASGRGRVMVDGAPRELARTSAEGGSAFGQFERQSFTGDGLDVQVSMKFEAQSRLIGGVKVPRGVLAIAGSGGWRISLPVAGLIGCRTAKN